MIIAINGYIGSGKDTVGNMIKSLTTEGFEIKKFAEKLKQVASMLTGIPREKFEDQDFKKLPLPRQWDTWCVEFDGNTYGCFATVEEAEEYEKQERSKLRWGRNMKTKVIQRPMLVREFLQKLGTDAVRYGLHPDTWVNALFADFDEDKDNWIITDCRFPNEARAVKERGGQVVRINRDLEQADYQTLEQRHPSETSLDDYTFDYIINNVGDLDDLQDRVKIMLRFFGVNF
jgi:hypothetical protein